MWEPVAPKARLGVDIAFRGGAPWSDGATSSHALLDAVARSQRDRAPQLVTLVGVPGIGKSRLVWELFAALDSDPAQYVTWRQGRSLPYGEGVAFWALGEMTKAQAGILESDDAEAAEAKLRAAVENVSPTRPRPAGWKVTSGRSRVWAGDASQAATAASEAFAAWRRFFEALAERAAHPRLRGPPLGGRRPARLRRPDGRMDDRCAAPDPLHGATRAPRPKPGVGRRQA